jgi:hypothetical protein
MIPTFTISVEVTGADGLVGKASKTVEIWPTEQWIKDNAGPRVTSFTKSTKNYTLTGSEVLTGLEIAGTVSFNSPNCGLRDCKITGTVVPPATNKALVSGTNLNGVNGFIDHCLIQPTTPSANWNGFNGRNVTVTHSIFRDLQDGVQVKNSQQPYPGPTNFNFWFNIVEDLVWVTAGVKGVVHPSDFETHNDLLQHMQFGGSDISWNLLNAKNARQEGHWVIRRKSDGYVYKRSEITPHLPPPEEWEQVPMNSLPDGGPWLPIRDRGTGTEDTGRYNQSVAAIMFGDEEGRSSYGLTFVGNRIRGGGIPFNSGGNGRPNPFPEGMWLIKAELNLFDRSQGHETQTFNFQASGWTAADATFVTTGARANRYMVGSDPDARTGELIRVRF